MKSPSQSGNALVLKAFNARLVEQALKLARSATCRELASSTGLSAVTVATVMRGLLEAGIAQEGELIPSNGGRPSRAYRFNENQSHVLSIFTREVKGQDTLCLRVADLYGQVIHAGDYPFTPGSLLSFEPFIDQALLAYPQIRALGFGLPGVEIGGSLVVLDYKPLVGAPIIEHFQTRYGLPVVFENDTNAATLGRAAQAGAFESEVYLYFPRKYPPGAGIRVAGKLLKGRRHLAGEVGLLPLGINWSDPGLTASLEASSEAIARVIASLCAVLDTDSIVLHGEFLTEKHLETICQRLALLRPAGMLPFVTMAGDFTQDFQDGLVGLTLALLEQQKDI